MRIDGYDHIEILVNIISHLPLDRPGAALNRKNSRFLVGSGFNEIFTTYYQQRYYRETELKHP
jgi:hypothetical protein